MTRTIQHTPLERRVRRAGSEDIHVVAGFVNALSRSFGDRPLCTPESLAANFSRIETYLVECDGVPVGYLAGFDTYKPQIDAVGFEVDNLYIDPDWRGLGLGRQLLSTVVADKTRSGVTRLTLSTRLDCPDLLAFYEAAGFRRVDTGTLARFVRE